MRQSRQTGEGLLHELEDKLMDEWMNRWMDG